MRIILNLQLPVYVYNDYKKNRFMQLTALFFRNIQSNLFCFPLFTIQFFALMYYNSKQLS